MSYVQLRVVHAGVAFALFLLSGCAPRTIPAVGTQLTFASCGITRQGVSLWHFDARCPSLARVDRVAQRVTDAYPRCNLGGYRVFVANAYVTCGDEMENPRGCQVGKDITIRYGGGVVATIEHELRHACIEQMDAPERYADPDKDRRRRIRNTLILGSDE